MSNELHRKLERDYERIVNAAGEPLQPKHDHAIAPRDYGEPFNSSLDNRDRRHRQQSGEPVGQEQVKQYECGCTTYGQVGDKCPEHDTAAPLTREAARPDLYECCSTAAPAVTAETKTFEQYVAEAVESAKAINAQMPQPVASVHVSNEGNAIEVHLDHSKSDYMEWIKGEGADIGLLRDQETNKVVGVRLPLYSKSIVFGGTTLPILRYELPSGKPIDIKDDYKAALGAPAVSSNARGDSPCLDSGSTSQDGPGAASKPEPAAGEAVGEHPLAKELREIIQPPSDLDYITEAMVRRAANTLNDQSATIATLQAQVAESKRLHQQCFSQAVKDQQEVARLQAENNSKAAKLVELRSEIATLKECLRWKEVFESSETAKGIYKLTSEYIAKDAAQQQRIEELGTELKLAVERHGRAMVELMELQEWVSRNNYRTQPAPAAKVSDSELIQHIQELVLIENIRQVLNQQPKDTSQIDEIRRLIYAAPAAAKEDT